MKKSLVSADLLFEIEDILGRKIRTTKSYWKKIKEVKHTELKFGTSEVKNTLKNPILIEGFIVNPIWYLWLGWVFQKKLR